MNKETNEVSTSEQPSVFPQLHHHPRSSALLCSVSPASDSETNDFKLMAFICSLWLLCTGHQLPFIDSQKILVTGNFSYNIFLNRFRWDQACNGKNLYYTLVTIQTLFTCHCHQTPSDLTTVFKVQILFCHSCCLFKQFVILIFRIFLLNRLRHTIL